MRVSTRNICTSLVIGFVMLLGSVTVNANHVLYTIEYSKSSEKGPSLENAQIRGQIFRGGNPAGYIQIKTDPNKQFRIPRDTGFVAIAIYSIEGEKKLSLKCAGNAYPDNHKIIAECHH